MSASPEGTHRDVLTRACCDEKNYEDFLVTFGRGRVGRDVDDVDRIPTRGRVGRFVDDVDHTTTRI